MVLFTAGLGGAMFQLSSYVRVRYRFFLLVLTRTGNSQEVRGGLKVRGAVNMHRPNLI